MIGTRARAGVRWGAAALLAVAVAVALTLTTLRLTDQHVGLTGEPASAGRGLVPGPPRTTTATHTVTVPAPARTVTAPPPAGTPAGDDGAEGGDD